MNTVIEILAGQDRRSFSRCPCVHAKPLSAPSRASRGTGGKGSRGAKIRGICSLFGR